jgi:carboxyl-terminal processing protease
MHLTLPKIRFIALSLIALILVFMAGYWSGGRNLSLGSESGKVTINRQEPQDKSDVDFALFWQVWDKIESSYFDKSKIDHKKMVYGAIQGMVSSLGDPYTIFLPPDDQKRTQEDLGGAFEGVGIQIGYQGTQLAVIAPLDGSPAQKAGVKAGDYIIGIKDKAKNLEVGTTGLSLPNAVDHIRGTAGTDITLVLTRSGVDKPFEVTMTRQKIDVPSVILTFESGNTAHLKLLKFGDKSQDEWNVAVNKIIAQGSKTMILDLRNNPGGYLNDAVSFASDFLKPGQVIVIQEDGHGNRNPLKATGNPRLSDIKLVVLVNKGSASASEIVAGALKDNAHGKIVGDKSFGKGTVQESQQLEQAGLHITTARWLTPNGTWVHGSGLTPDVEISDDPSTQNIDEQLQKALELLK